MRSPFDRAFWRGPPNLFCRYRCPHGSVLSISYRYLFCLAEQSKKLNLMLLRLWASCCLQWRLMHTLVAFPISQRAKRRQSWIHGPLWRGHRCSTDRGGREPWLPTQLSSRTGAQLKELEGEESSQGSGEGWFSVRKCHCTSCLRVYWSLALEEKRDGEGWVEEQGCRFGGVGVLLSSLLLNRSSGTR